MKGRTISAIGIIAAITAAALIYFRNMTAAHVVVAGGILFVAVGLINMICFSIGRGSIKGLARILSIITNTGAIVLGISMLVFTSTFSPLIPFVFGLLSAVCALWQFFLLAAGTRPVRLPGWLYIFPMAIVDEADYTILLSGAMPESATMLITGIALATFALACLIEGTLLGNEHRKAIRATAQSPEITTDDLDDTDTPQPEKETPKTNEIGVNEKKSTK